MVIIIMITMIIMMGWDDDHNDQNHNVENEANWIIKCVLRSLSTKSSGFLTKIRTAALTSGWDHKDEYEEVSDWNCWWWWWWWWWWCQDGKKHNTEQFEQERTKTRPDGQNLMRQLYKLATICFETLNVQRTEIKRCLKLKNRSLCWQQTWLGQEHQRKSCDGLSECMTKTTLVKSIPVNILKKKSQAC